MSATLTTLLAAAALLGVGVLGGCEDEDGPLECVRRPATGGDLVGVWEPFEFCNDPKAQDTVLAGCPDARLAQQGSHALGGTITLGADGSYRDDSILSQSFRIVAPLSCYPAATSCALLGSYYQNLLAPPAQTPNPAQMVEAQAFCRGSDPCTCALQVKTTYHQTSTYRVDGTKVFLDGLELNFSVVGNELRIHTEGATVRLVRK